MNGWGGSPLHLDLPEHKTFRPSADPYVCSPVRGGVYAAEPETGRILGVDRDGRLCQERAEYAK